MKRIACLSQKGGVGKSTLARDISVQFASNDWKVRIADLDVRQSTSHVWAETRRQAEIKPEVFVASFGSASDALAANGVDLVVVDGKPYSDVDTRKIGKGVDLVLIPTGPTTDDLYPQILLAHELVKEGVSKANILFVLNSVASNLDGSEVTAAKQYVEEAGYRVAKTVIPRRAAYGQIHNEGRSISEVPYPTLRAHAANLMDEVASTLMGEQA